MHMKYSEKELKQKNISCKNCGSVLWMIVGEGKYDRNVLCQFCKSTRNMTISEFYPPGSFVD